MQEHESAPAQPLIPVWYPAENNWQICIDKMALAFRRISDEYTGAASDQQRAVGGSEGQTRTAHVVDLYEDEHFSGISSWFRGGQNADLANFQKPFDFKRLFQFSLNFPYPMSDLMAGAFNPRAGRVYQGMLEDFYLIEGLQTIGMKPQLIANIFVNMEFSNPRLGVYTLRLYKQGQWQNVTIDDSLPFDKDGKLCCCSSEFDLDMAWPSLIEKAYAKVHGSWEGLGGGGHVEEVLTDLTGGCATRFSTTDVAPDRLWQYLAEMDRYCVFGCNINEAGCSKRSVPIDKHWACSIFRLAKHDGVPYVCVCTAAPLATVRHMPLCQVPSIEGYGIHDGMVWLRIDDFVAFFDTIYECRLVNSDLGPPAMTGLVYSPAWMLGYPWFEEMWAFQGDVHSETAPSFLIQVTDCPNEITMEVSQTDIRYFDPDFPHESGRGVQVPLLLRFYQCSAGATDVDGGEMYLVHLSAWGHTRDACCAVKVFKPGKYLAMVSLPAKYVCHRMIFRTYSTAPLALKPITQHRTWVAVNPAMPLNAMPYSLSGFQRIDAASEKLPQMFDEAEGRGKPMANAQDFSQHGSFFGDQGRQNLQAWRRVAQDNFRRVGTAKDETGQRIVGKFGGRNAVATVEAAEMQDGCCAM